MQNLILGRERAGARVISVSARRRFRAVYVIGRSGAGKSSLLHRCLHQDAKAGHATMLFDPGDLADDVRESLPARLLSRVDYFSIARPIPYNPLARRRDEPARLEHELFSLIDQVSAEMREAQPLTSRMARLLSHAIRAVVTDPAADFGTLVRYLHDRRAELERVMQLGKGDDSFAKSWDGVRDRLSTFLRDPRIRRVLCNGHALDFGRVIDEGRILLVSLAGLEPALQRFTGTLLLNGLQATILERPETARRPVSVFIDEFHNFLASRQAVQNFQVLFNQGRRHLVSLCVAHTDFGSVPEPMLATIHDNAGTVVAFSCGPEPARKLSAIFAGEWPQEAIQLLPDRNAIVRTGDESGDSVHPIETYPAPQKLRPLLDERRAPPPFDPPDPFETVEGHAHDYTSRRPRAPRPAPQASPAA